MDFAPVLLFVYNRPEHTKSVISSLLKNEIASQTPLIVYSDAAHEQSDEENVSRTRDIVRRISGFASVDIIERDTNYGLANNIIDGVTTQINKYGCVIVLEDDLVVSSYFLAFMNDALRLYENESRVGHIQAYDFTHDASLPDTFLIKWTGSWGWATWKRAWDLFNPNGKELLQELEQRNLTHYFDFNGNYPFTRMLRRQISGEVNSWAIRWNASLFLRDILSLNVGRSLVQNTGFDGTGTNCGEGNLYESSLYMKPLVPKLIQPIVEDINARKSFEVYYHHTNCFQAKALRRIKRILKGDFRR